MTGNEARRLFLEYFQKQDHQIVRSSSLVPQDDPTLLFINAGMVQFKRVFLGEEKRDYVRATTSQKCVRAGGKHNDLENVGYTARHHTFFEMLGNFSFGNYFKEKATEYAWDLLTNGYGLPADKLWASVYLDDDEAYDLWHDKIGVPTDRIVRLGEEDNFWSMGDTGPCGPCSEILLDRGEQFGCGKPECTAGCDCDRYLEIWNLVFMQFNRDEAGNMTPLPKPSIDTGLGLERIVSIIQDVPTNYHTDLIRPVIARGEEMAGVSFGADFQSDVALKVIADHSRAAAFLIGDGILPSNEGRGYVLRRIMRRAIRYGRYLGLNKPFLYRTAEKVFEIMKPAYPELTEASAFITNVIQNEEERFLHTLDVGLRLLNDTVSDLKAAGEAEIPGDIIFKLYDTYGFPVDIVQDVVRDEELTLDMAGFDAAMAGQKARSRTKTTFTHVSEAYRQLSSAGTKSEFVGYSELEDKAPVLLIVEGDVETAEATAGQTVEVVTAKTPFYGESGGQVGDTGTISGADGTLSVTDTVKDPSGLSIHKGKMIAGVLRKGETVTLKVDAAQRTATQLNHTATHILHAVLRKVLGDHVKQAGSLVSPDRLRFDFSHFSRVESDELEQIELLVNRQIRANIATRTEEMDADEAFKSGAMALFEEKYGDRVRVVSLPGFSKELCGGTHTRRTGDIGLFRIVSESSVAAGVRRIEALTGDGALAFTQQMNRALIEAAHCLKEKPTAVPQRSVKLLAELKQKDREIEHLKHQLSTASGDNEEDEVKTINGVNVLSRKVVADNPSGLRDLADHYKDKLRSGIVVLGAVSGKKALLIAAVTKDLTDRFHAGNIIKDVAAIVGGRGGGRPDMAQAGGTQPENLEQALAKVAEIVESA